MTRKQSLSLFAAAALAFVALPAAAQEGPWMVRVRGVELAPENGSDAIPSLAVPTDAIEVSKKFIPEVDISYFFNKYLAAELILTYPQKHTVTVTQSAVGSFEAGTFKHLPPTLTLQYHFLPDAPFQPYVGAGVNLTLISSVDLEVPGVTPLDLESSSIGAAFQAGFDVKIAPNVYLNADVKKISIKSDLLNGSGAKISSVTVSPWAFAGGIGVRF